MNHEIFQRHLALSQQLQHRYSADEANQIALLWLEHVTQTDWKEWKRHPDRPWNPDWEQPFQTGVAALLAGQPVQHLMGYGYFYGRHFAVGPDVLIPRQETEELPAWALELIAGQPRPRVPDVGTGSGRLAVSLVLEAGLRRQAVEMTAMDVSEAALTMARRNAHTYEATVHWWQQDIFQADLSGELPFDLILSNPPYVTESERGEMSSLVLDHEPWLALFAPAEDPLAFYRRIAALAIRALRPGGSLLFEINPAFGTDMLALMAHTGFTDLELRKDLQGRDRMVGGTRPPTR